MAVKQVGCCCWLQAAVTHMPACLMAEAAGGTAKTPAWAVQSFVSASHAQPNHCQTVFCCAAAVLLLLRPCCCFTGHGSQGGWHCHWCAPGAWRDSWPRRHPRQLSLNCQRGSSSSGQPVRGADAAAGWCRAPAAARGSTVIVCCRARGWMLRRPCAAPIVNGRRWCRPRPAGQCCVLCCRHGIVVADMWKKQKPILPMHHTGKAVAGSAERNACSDSRCSSTLHHA